MANDQPEGKISGIDKAAILLLSLGEEAASEVLRHIGPKEVHKISSAMAEMRNISTAQVQNVITDFSTLLGSETSFGIGSQDYLRSVLVKALGEDKAGSIIDRVLMGENVSGLEQLKWMDPRAIAEIIKLEHPQIIAVVLSYLDSELSAEVLTLLPEGIRSDIILRMATLDRLQPSALVELNSVIEKQFTGNDHVKSSTVGGKNTAANLLNMIEPSMEAVIIDGVSEIDSELAERIQDLMFVFDDLATIDDKGIQMLLREISSETLVTALKGSDEGIKQKIFTNMSKRAGDMLKEDLEAKGPVRLSDVEAAQKEILMIARRMQEAGELSLGGQGGDEYV
jgi:flagellar motor switch protein FliG